MLCSALVVCSRSLCALVAAVIVSFAFLSVVLHDRDGVPAEPAELDELPELTDNDIKEVDTIVMGALPASATNNDKVKQMAHEMLRVHETNDTYISDPFADAKLKALVETEGEGENEGEIDGEVDSDSHGDGAGDGQATEAKAESESKGENESEGTDLVESRGKQVQPKYPGHCGPQYEDQKCHGHYSGPDKPEYCNEETGWCGVTAGHRDAQASTQYDYIPPTTPESLSGKAPICEGHNDPLVAMEVAIPEELKGFLGLGGGDEWQDGADSCTGLDCFGMNPIVFKVARGGFGDQVTKGGATTNMKSENTNKNPCDGIPEAACCADVNLATTEEREQQAKLVQTHACTWRTSPLSTTEKHCYSDSGVRGASDACEHLPLKEDEQYLSLVLDPARMTDVETFLDNAYSKLPNQNAAFNPTDTAVKAYTHKAAHDKAMQKGSEAKDAAKKKAEAYFNSARKAMDRFKTKIPKPSAPSGLKTFEFPLCFAYRPCGSKDANGKTEKGTTFALGSASRLLAYETANPKFPTFTFTAFAFSTSNDLQMNVQGGAELWMGTKTGRSWDSHILVEGEDKNQSEDHWVTGIHAGLWLRGAVSFGINNKQGLSIINLVFEIEAGFRVGGSRPQTASPTPSPQTAGPGGFSINQMSKLFSNKWSFRRRSFRRLQEQEVAPVSVEQQLEFLDKPNAAMDKPMRFTALLSGSQKVVINVGNFLGVEPEGVMGDILNGMPLEFEISKASALLNAGDGQLDLALAHVRNKGSHQDDNKGFMGTIRKTVENAPLLKDMLSGLTETKASVGQYAYLSLRDGGKVQGGFRVQITTEFVCPDAVKWAFEEILFGGKLRGLCSGSKTKTFALALEGGTGRKFQNLDVDFCFTLESKNAGARKTDMRFCLSDLPPMKCPNAAQGDWCAKNTDCNEGLYCKAPAKGAPTNVGFCLGKCVPQVPPGAYCGADATNEHETVANAQHEYCLTNKTNTDRYGRCLCSHYCDPNTQYCHKGKSVLEDSGNVGCKGTCTYKKEVAPAFVVLFLMFSGFLINEESVPVWLSWLQEISFIRYAFKALAINEFRGTTFDCDGTAPAADGAAAPPCLDGDQVLARLNFTSSIATNCFVLIGTMAAFHATAYAILILRRPKYLKLAAHGKGL
eukprot:g3420.t1